MCVLVRVCVCVFLREHLLLVGFVFPSSNVAHPCRGCWTPWKREEDRDGARQRRRKRNTPAAISVEWILSHLREISISWVFRKLQLSVSHFPYPLFTLCFPSLLLSLSPQWFSRAWPRSIHLPQGSRCWVWVQMLCVYPSPITSSSHTVNIYRGVSPPQLPYRSETGRKKGRGWEEIHVKKTRSPVRPTHSHARCWDWQLFLFSSVC